MAKMNAADTIRILVATDNHVGYNERDPIRGDDSWKAFHEIMCLAKERDVDMVLLAGDLFHENKPSRKAMYNVMRSLRMNCYGEKPCELEMLSDGSEHFDGTFDHANYEDPDINVAIPVFSIHGNHDDPSGEGHLAALDILEVSGLINYYGRTPESDNINVKPVLLQKGGTKLALFGLSNVRDERLYRTFRDGKVKFFRPSTQKDDWFNLICVHQNHHAYTETSHLPENFLPDFLDLVIWGHEHECIIEPQPNPEMNFKVIQPGSSVATSLVAGEAIPKHVCILSITGCEFKSEPIRLKTVRPFIYRDITLSREKEALKIARKGNHRAELTRFLMRLVEELIDEAKRDWQDAQEQSRSEDDDEDEPEVPPLPLVRLRVEITAPEGAGKFDCENPQRFSNRFIDKVANVNDIVQFYSKKRVAPGRGSKDEVAEEAIMSNLQGLDTVKVEKLVREFLAAQSLTILPQNYFGDAVAQFIDKDDKHAMEMFVNESLTSQIKHLVSLHADDLDEEDEGGLAAQIDKYRSQLEDMFAKGALKSSKANKARYKPKPDSWDSDLDGGEWEDQPGALLRPDEEGSDNEEDDDEDGTPAARPAARGRGRGRGGRGAAATSIRGASSTKKPALTTSRSKKKTLEDNESDEDDDIVRLDDDDDDEDEDNSQAMFFKDTEKASIGKRGTNATSARTRGRKAASPIKKPPPRTASAKVKQATLNFTSSQASVLGNGKRPTQGASVVNNDIDDDDDDDAFEPLANVKIRSRR